MSRVRSRRVTYVASAMALVAIAAAGCGSSAKKTKTNAASVAAVTNPTTTPTTPATTTSTHHAHKSTSHKKTKSTTSHSHKSTTTHTTTTSTTKTNTTSTTSSNPAPKQYVPVGPLHATFTGQNHDPVATAAWYYTVTATDGRGQGLSGTVDTEFVFNGQVVGHESPPTHPLTNGQLHNHVEFPAEAIGIPLMVQVVVITKVGTKTLDWPVRTKK